MRGARAPVARSALTEGACRTVTFRDYMESSLYGPGGYYERRTPREDFYTAPELHGAFAGILAGEIAGRLRTLADRGLRPPYFVVEMGSGSGALGAGVLRAMHERHPSFSPKVRYVFVERAESQLLRSIGEGAASERVLGYSRLDDVPPCSGVFLSNELVDAFPIHLLQKNDGKIYEVYVQRAGPGAGGIRGADGVRAQLGELSRPELAPVAEAVSAQLPEGGRHAVNLEAAAWMRLVAERLLAGSVITIDYGKRFGPQPQPNPPRSFYRHRAGDEVLEHPGRQDLTASVDFDSLISAGETAGLKFASYTTLSRFLLDRGIMDWLPSGGPNDVAAVRERNKIKTLLHPDGMGEVFKVLIQEKEAAARA